MGLDWDPDWWILVDVNPSEWSFEELLDRESMFVFREHDRYLVGERDNVMFIDFCVHPNDEDDWEWHGWVGLG